LDIDPDVFPFLNLHAKFNGVEIKTKRKKFDKLTVRELREFDVIIGADICFWDSLVNPLRKLIIRALRADVGLIIIADPGRSPFENLGAYFTEKSEAEVLDRTVQKPRRIRGQLLKIKG